MMEVTLLSKTGTSAKHKLPSQFGEKVRPDLIERAVHSIQSKARQPYARDPEAGKRVSADLRKRRRKYRGSYGKGISRIKRKIMSRNGMQMQWVGAFAPQAVGGRRAHPPKIEKVWALKINDKERRKAIRSALAATMFKEIVIARGHKVPANYPFIVESDVQEVKKTAQIKKVLELWGFSDDLARAAFKRIRAGRGKSRGRKHKKAKTILVVVDGPCPLSKSLKNIPGVDVVSVTELNASVLAPGGVPGRATVFTKKAIDKLEKEKLYL